MNKILTQIGNIGIVPVVAISDVNKAVPLAKALLTGGIPCAEVTFRTAEGEECLRLISEQMPEVLAGAGTILTALQAKKAINAGAKFIVSPGLNPAVVTYCLENNITVIPGCVTPTEMEAAMALGLDVVKFFPAEQAGGLAYIKAVSAPYPGLRFMPTGGITKANIGEYLSFQSVIACGGSFMVTKDMLVNGDFAKISALSREAVEIVKKSRK